MIDVPENIKEIIDSSIKEAFAPFGKILEQKPHQVKQEIANKDERLDGVSEAVKAFLKDQKEQPFAGKTIAIKRISGGGTSPADIEKM